MFTQRLKKLGEITFISLPPHHKQYTAVIKSNMTIPCLDRSKQTGTDVSLKKSLIVLYSLF